MNYFSFIQTVTTAKKKAKTILHLQILLQVLTFRYTSYRHEICKVKVKQFPFLKNILRYLKYV